MIKNRQALLNQVRKGAGLNAQKRRAVSGGFGGLKGYKLLPQSRCKSRPKLSPKGKLMP